MNSVRNESSDTEQGPAILRLELIGGLIAEVLFKSDSWGFVGDRWHRVDRLRMTIANRAKRTEPAV